MPYRGRKKSPLSCLFTDIQSESKVKRVKCNFCGISIAKNGTRMAEHIKNCRKCSVEVKTKYLSKLPHSEKYVGSQSSGTLKSMEQSSEEETVCGSGSCASESEQGSTHSVHLQVVKNKAATMKTFTKKASTSVRNTGEMGKSQQKSTTMKWSSFFDNVSDSENEKITKLLARAIYASAAPLSLVENPYWKKFFKTIRPAYKPPNRQMISNSLLEEEHLEISMKVKELVASSSSVAIVCDGWTNIRNEAIVNFIITLPEPVFWYSLPTGSTSHTAENMALEIGKVIEEVGQSKVLGLCTDNAANMKKAWNILKDKYHHLLCYGCTAHGLNLIFSDVRKIKSVATLLEKCVSLVKHIRNSHKLLAIFKEEQKSCESRVETALKLPVKTRWGSSVHCLQSILVNKHTLQSMAINEAVQESLGREIKNTILSEVFWDQVAGFLSLLKPVSDAITVVEGDNKELSIVMKVFKEIEVSLKSQISQSPLLKKEETAVMAIFKTRKEFCIKNIHYAANLVDPKFQGKHLTDEEIVDAFDIIHEVSRNMEGINESKIIAELADYRSKQKLFSKEYLWKAVMHTTSVSWWKGLCGSLELSKVAIAILNLPPTSAAAERSFSRYGNVHTQKRNRLTNERAAKLVYVAHNLQLMDEDENNAGQNTSMSMSMMVQEASSSQGVESTDDDPDDVMLEENEDHVQEQDTNVSTDVELSSDSD